VGVDNAGAAIEVGEARLRVHRDGSISMNGKAISLL
jgi:hypothetical protein